MNLQPFTSADVAAVRDQLGREPRAVAGVAWRCPCGRPGVIATEPRLPNGSPFPTTYYATCPRLTGPISTLESSGLMAEMSQRLLEDEDLAARYRAAHEDYLARRAELGDVPGIEFEAGTERAQDVEHEPDDDEVHADVEDERGDDVQLADERHGHVVDPGLQHRAARDHRAQSVAGREEQADQNHRE